MPRHALLVVDVQVDFCPGGSLPVKNGDLIIPIINHYIERFRRYELPVLASRDWHPRDSTHFAINGGRWPVHCVQNTPGAKYHPRLILPETTIILSTGVDRLEDGYTAFQGRDETGQFFDEILQKYRIRRLAVCGLATDYCVKWSVLDALERGLLVDLLLDAIKGIDEQPEDSRKAIDEMVDHGANPVTYETLTLDLD